MTPYFEVNGKRYEVINSRFFKAEIQKMADELKFNSDEEIAIVKTEEITKRIEAIKAKKDELFNKYMETYDEQDYDNYLKLDNICDVMTKQLAEILPKTEKYNQTRLKFFEQVVIKAIQFDENGDVIRSEEEATTAWESYVDKVGAEKAFEFIVCAVDELTQKEEEENPFVAKVKARIKSRQTKQAKA